MKCDAKKLASRKRRYLRKAYAKLRKTKLFEKLIEEKVIFAGRKGLFTENLENVPYEIYIMDYSEKLIVYEISGIRKQIPRETLSGFKKLINLNVESNFNVPVLAAIC